MKILNYLITIDFAKKKTCWWHNLDTNANAREDHLISLTRIYSRTDKEYIYRLILGRLNIQIVKLQVDE